jgi:hypothetical protein
MLDRIREIDISMKISWLGLGIYGLLMITAMIVYPNYNQFEQTLSKLGTLWPSSLFFSLGMIIAALTIAWLVLLMKDDIQTLFPAKKKQFQIIGILFTLMIIFMIGIVFFPSSGATSDIHDVIAITLFILMAIVTSWVSVIAGSSLLGWNKYISYLGYACSVSVVILGFLLVFWEFGPLVQKITVAEFNIWIVLVVYEFKQYVARGQ